MATAGDIIHTAVNKALAETGNVVEVYAALSVAHRAVGTLFDLEVAKNRPPNTPPTPAQQT